MRRRGVRRQSFSCWWLRRYRVGVAWRPVGICKVRLQMGGSQPMNRDEGLIWSWKDELLHGDTVSEPEPSRGAAKPFIILSWFHSLSRGKLCGR